MCRLDTHARTHTHTHTHTHTDDTHVGNEQSVNKVWFTESVHQRLEHLHRQHILKEEEGAVRRGRGRGEGGGERGEREGEREGEGRGGKRGGEGEGEGRGRERGRGREEMGGGEREREGGREGRGRGGLSGDQTCNNNCSMVLPLPTLPMFQHIRTLSRYLRAVLWKSSSGNTIYKIISITESK